MRVISHSVGLSDIRNLFCISRITRLIYAFLTDIEYFEMFRNKKSVQSEMIEISWWKKKKKSNQQSEIYRCPTKYPFEMKWFRWADCMFHALYEKVALGKDAHYWLELH